MLSFSRAMAVFFGFRSAEALSKFPKFTAVLSSDRIDSSLRVCSDSSIGLPTSLVVFLDLPADLLKIPATNLAFSGASCALLRDVFEMARRMELAHPRKNRVPCHQGWESAWVASRVSVLLMSLDARMFAEIPPATWPSCCRASSTAKLRVARQRQYCG